MEQFSEALSYFDLAISKDQGFKDAWYSKGGVFISLKKYCDAVVCYKRVLQIDPHDVDAKIYLQDLKKHIEEHDQYDVCPECHGHGIISYGYGDDPHYHEEECSRCKGSSRVVAHTDVGDNVCPDCNGQGVIDFGYGDDPHYREEKCSRCAGTGRL
jgi:tetratricopeptide (TPR) repeat protein